MTEEEDADQLLAMEWANETVPSWRNTYDLIRRVRSEERESRLRAERERKDWREAARLTRETVTVLADQKAALRKALATAERERDEARLILAATVSAADQDRARAQKRIEGLEAALRQIRDGVFAPNIVAGYALSSPAPRGRAHSADRLLGRQAPTGCTSMKRSTSRDSGGSMTDFERGAEAMRSRLAYEAAHVGHRLDASAILAIPLPVQPPGSESRGASERCTGHLVHDPYIFCPVHDA